MTHEENKPTSLVFLSCSVKHFHFRGVYAYSFFRKVLNHSNLFNDEPGRITTIKLHLRRTLVLQQFYSENKHKCMNFLLRLKHWQLFLITIGIPFIIKFIFIASTGLSQDSSFMIITYLIVSMIGIAILFAWFYALGINLHKKLPEAVKMNLTRFKILLLITALYALFFIFWINIRNNITSDQQVMTIDLRFLIPVYLFFIFCILYSFYFIAKALKAVELKKPVSFDDFVGDFVLLLIYPIGMWIIQPKINDLFAFRNR